MSEHSEDKSAQFEPSPEQAALLRHYQAKEYGCKVTDACAECNIGRRTYYTWMDNPEFQGWWDRQSQKWCLRRLPELRKAALAAAVQKAGRQEQKYNPAAIRLALELVDKNFVPKSAQDVTIRTAEAELEQLLDDADTTA